MQHPFETLAPEYLDLLGRMTITREAEARKAAARIIKLMPRYKAVAAKTNVPAIWLAAVNERESSSSFLCYFGNGDRLSVATRHVPAGRGPFTGPDAWEKGCCDALALDRVSSVTDWSWARACYEGELWNGFGPRGHGRHTGYLWSGTSVYDGGKYISDGQWAPGAEDAQLGIIPIMLALIDLDASFALPGWPANRPWPHIPAPAPIPAEHDGGGHGTKWLQESLNTLLNADLVVDGSFGRKTGDAVRQFQAAHGLAADGAATPATIAAIETALAPPSNDIAKTAARLATAIYDYPSYPKETWDHVIQCENGLYATIKRHADGTDYVSIRGTVTLMDWVRNVEAWTVHVKGIGPVHNGFHIDIPEAWSKIQPLLGSKFVIAGHSRGAAEAKILAAYAIRDGKYPAALICFGAPRAGYKELADLLKAIPCKSYRNTAGAVDPVTKVPFTLDWIEPFIDEIAFTDVSVAPTPDDTFPNAPADFRPHYMPLYDRALNGEPLPLAQLSQAA